MTGITRIAGGTLADRAFEQIEAAIVTGELAPGARISEVTLARTLGVSRGPLREAIRRLEGRKLVKRVSHVGTTVVAFSPDEIVQALFVREAVEGMACRLAAQHISADELRALDILLDRHAEAEGRRTADVAGQASGDLDFHARVARASGNRWIADLLAGELHHLVRVHLIHLFGYRPPPARPAQAIQEHRSIVAALRARDADRAERLMREHIARSRANLERAAARGLAPRAREH